MTGTPHHNYLLPVTNLATTKRQWQTESGPIASRNWDSPQWGIPLGGGVDGGGPSDEEEGDSACTREQQE